MKISTFVLWISFLTLISLSASAFDAQVVQARHTIARLKLITSKTIWGTNFDHQHFCEKLHSSAIQMEKIPYRELLRVLSESEIESIISTFFEARIHLNRQIKELYRLNHLDANCARAFRSVIGKMTPIEDAFAEKVLQPSRRIGIALRGHFPQMLANEAQEKWQLRSGDLLLSRGDTFVSSAISNIGDYDGRFSHLAFAYQEPLSKDWYAVESHIETGLSVTPLETYMKQPKVRVSVYRTEIAKLGETAAGIIFQKWLDSRSSPNPKPILYDFQMNSKDESELYCSEVISTGIRQALFRMGFHEYEIPLFTTKINPEKTPFLRQLGIEFLDVFTPSDIEVDPRFILMADWRNPEFTPKSRNRDLVMKSIFGWMNTDGYQLKPNLSQALFSSGAWAFKKLFGDQLETTKRIPENISVDAITTIIDLEFIGEKILTALEDYQSYQGRKHDHLVSDQESLDYLELLKNLDAKTFYKTPNAKSLIHEFLRAENKKVPESNSDL
ncbi:MAG: hypothetical protein RJB66_2505 [Pseudomonadota bacterium]